MKSFGTQLHIMVAIEVSHEQHINRAHKLYSVPSNSELLAFLQSFGMP